jgi:hypothetical protein
MNISQVNQGQNIACGYSREPPVYHHFWPTSRWREKYEIVGYILKRLPSIRRFNQSRPPSSTSCPKTATPDQTSDPRWSFLFILILENIEFIRFSFNPSDRMALA